MLKYFWKKRGQRGFTLIELVVVLAILGILIALAVPRYLGARKNALVAEGDNTLQELKTLAWAYYMQYNTWAPITTSAIMMSAFGFTAPGLGCWAYAPVSPTGTLIPLRATSGAAGARAACGILASGSSITLTMSGDGSSVRAQVVP